VITIKNTQRSIKIDLKAIKRDAQKILDLLDYPDFDLGIWFTTNTTIRTYNKKFRNKDKPTDILSFPFHQELKAGQRIKPVSADDKNLGDLILSPSYIHNDAPRYKLTLEERIRVLLVHGICHLLGYDHIDDADYKLMHKKEMEILKKLSK
jgi:probable rRNA maturation factor